MKVIDIKQIKCTVLGSSTGFVNGHLVCKDIEIDLILALFDRWKEKISQLRSMEYHSEQQRKYKQMFPCWTVSGTFPQNNLRDGAILTYSNLIAVDIDGIDNPGVDLDSLKKQIFELPYVVWVMKSISGQGLFALILVEDGHYTKDYLRYIEKLFADKFAINIDSKCFNLGRKRFISYDEDLLIKRDYEEITPFNLKLPEKPVEPPKPHVDCSRYKHNEEDLDNEFAKKVDLLIEFGYDCGPHWSDWMSLGRIFKPFPDGCSLFNKLSSHMSAYDPRTFMKHWNQVRNDIVSKDHAIAYITTILNKECPGWKDSYYKTNDIYIPEEFL